MRVKPLRAISLFAVLLAAVALTSGCSRYYGSTVVSAGENQLTISDKEGQSVTHEVAPDAEITLDGQPAALEDLDAGDAVSIKVENREGDKVATEIKAKSQESIEIEAEEQQPDADVQQPAMPGDQPDIPSGDQPPPSQEEGVSQPGPGIDLERGPIPQAEPPQDGPRE